MLTPTITSPFSKTTEVLYAYFYFGGDIFTPAMVWIETLQISFIGIFVLFLALFFPRNGKFTRFLNKLISEYLILLVFLSTFTVVQRAINAISKMPKADWWDIAGKNLAKFSYNNKLIQQASEELADRIFLMQSNSLFYNFFLLFSLLSLAILFYGLADRYYIGNSYDIEFTLLVIIMYVGSLIIFLSHNLIEFVLGLEVISLGSYALAAYERKSRFSAYAGVQYFIIGSIPSGMLIFSLAILYRIWGTLSLENIDILLSDTAKYIYTPDTVALDEALKSYKFKTIFDLANLNANLFQPSKLKDEPLMVSLKITAEFCKNLYRERVNVMNQWESIGVESTYLWKSTEKQLVEFYVYAMSYFNNGFFDYVLSGTFADKKTEMVLALILVLFNLLFKITAAPFNFWAPSVYGKAPVASATYLSIFSKIVVFFALFKLLITIFAGFPYVIVSLLLGCSVFSIIFGMAGAFAEKTIKRFYVYSSMGHVGFILSAAALATGNGYAALFHYLLVYVISSYLMWFVLMLLGRKYNNIVHFGILKYFDKWLATIFALLIFSMSGIPPLGGFFVKLDVLIALIENSKYYINYLLLIFSVISFFYYLRLVKIIFFDERPEYSRDIFISEDRFWIVGFLFLVLLFYMFLIHKPFLDLEYFMFQNLIAVTKEVNITQQEKTSLASLLVKDLEDLAYQIRRQDMGWRTWLLHVLMDDVQRVWTAMYDIPGPVPVEWVERFFAFYGAELAGMRDSPSKALLWDRMSSISGEQLRELAKEFPDFSPDY